MKRWFIILAFYSTSLWAQSPIPIAEYLAKAKSSKVYAPGAVQDSNPLVSAVELRASVKEDELDEVKFHITPFASGEREKLKNVSGLERSILEESLKGQTKEVSYELWLSVLELKKLQEEKNALQDLIRTSDLLIKAVGSNSAELAARPDTYIQALSNHQEYDLRLRETKAQIESLEASLGALVNLPKVSLDYTRLISPLAMREDIASTYLTVGQTADPLKTLMAERAEAEVQLEHIKEDRLLNFFTIGTSFKPDGSSRAIELGFGIEVPVGTHPARLVELERKKLMAQSDAETSRLVRQREMKRLSTRLADRLNQMHSGEVRAAEEKMDNVNQAIFKTYGKGSLVALKSQFAIEKYRLDKLESVASLYEDYLALNFLTGRLTDNGRPLLKD